MDSSSSRQLPEAHWPPIAIGPDNVVVKHFFSTRRDDLTPTMDWRPGDELPGSLCWGCDKEIGDGSLGLCERCRVRLL